MPVRDSPPVKNILPVAPPKADPSKLQSDTSKFSITTAGDTIYKKNTVDSFSLYRISKDSLNGPVVYHADDSMVLDVPTKKMYLYGKTSSIKYTDNELGAPEIEYDQQTGLVRAHLVRDSTGKVISFVSFNQPDFKAVMDSIVFDMRTLKGITKGTYTQQGEIFVSGKTIKKVGKDVFYALDSKFTTCNLDTPHFAFVSHKIKFISQKMAFSGPVHPEFEGVPVPIVLPFGIYPLAQGRHSGLLAPTFAASDQYGISLERLGYYKVISPNWDVITTGTLYSYGGWAVNVNPRYYKRYHYQGNLSLDIQKTKPLDLPSTRTVFINWSHTMDTKARPGVTFTASVRAGSSKYNQLVPNNATQNFTNQMQSSIAYSKTWKDKPYNVIISANHSQNTNSGVINLNIPDVAFNLVTLYPFRRKNEDFIGEYKWYENLGVGLTTNTKSQTFFVDTAKRIVQQIKDNLQWGASHTVPITLSLPQMGVFQVSPGISYSERWYMEQTFRTWNDVLDTTITTRKQGFYTAREMSFSLSATTRIFGMYSFKKSSKVQAIRHEIRPSLSMSYKPDMAKASFYKTRINSLNDSDYVSKYERSIYGAYSRGEFGGMSFSIDNNISMKVRSKKDTSNGGLKKITIIDGLRLDGSYNFLADSFRLSPLTLSARSNLFEKINLTAGATFDPYQRNVNGKRLDKLVWANRPLSLGTLTSGSVSLQSGFKGGDKSKQTSSELTDQNTLQQNAGAIGMPLNDYEQEAAYIRNNPGEFVDFSIPWSVDFSYSLRFGRNYIESSNKSTVDFNQDVTFNGSINLTPKWKLGMNGSFNITQKQLGLLSMYLSREMHCWQMTINVSRSDRQRYFTINISPKSPMLRDLKVNRTRYFIGN
ncbi:LPS-assembly protein LptD [Ferruginibacter sp. HRS2-29]|nr:LPS-assembly protein LptD [Ferruginibacter sp. HRS2-29]